MRILFSIVIVLFTGGCVGNLAYESVKASSVLYGKKLAAAALRDAEYYTCRVSPIGAVMDRFWGRPTEWTAYLIRCRKLWGN